MVFLAWTLRKKYLIIVGMSKVYDLIVVGGGVAGVSAALSAKRKGKTVALIEKGSMLGGLATSGLINWFEPLCDGKGHQLLHSICEELFNLALNCGYNTFDPNWNKNKGRMVSWFNHNLFALSLNKLLIDENIHIYYETLVSDVFLDDSLIKEIEIITVEDKKRLIAKTFIDASGTAILYRKSNLSVREGTNYLVYVTTTYKDGIDKPTFQYTGAFPDGQNQIKDARTYSGLKNNDVNEFLIEGQLHCLKEYKDKIKKDISSLPSMPQFRKVASIEGEYTLTKQDLFIHHEDSIGAFGVFYKPGDIYEIPMGCLYSNKVKNLFAAGRIISSTDDAWEAIRVIPVAILTGEAAGLMSSLYIENKLNVNNVQKELIERGVKLHY